MNKYKGVYFTICSLFFLLFIFSACHLQKRRYNKGFYINKASHSKAYAHYKIDTLERSKAKTNTSKIIKEIGVKQNEDSVEIISNISSTHDKLSKKDIPPLIFSSDTIIKKGENNFLQKNSKAPKPRMELFSKLALIAFMVSLIITLAIIWIAIAFSFPEILLLLLFINIFIPAISLLLAFEGNSRVRKNPKKVRYANLSKETMKLSILLCLFNLFLLVIYLMSLSAAVIW